MGGRSSMLHRRLANCQKKGGKELVRCTKVLKSE